MVAGGLEMFEDAGRVTMYVGIFGKVGLTESCT